MYNLSTFWEQVAAQICNAGFGTAIVDGQFPASGSYIDVSRYARFMFLIRAGTLDSALTCTVKAASTTSGTLHTVTGATVTVGATDDNKIFLIEVETRKLLGTAGDRYVTLDVAGAAGGNDFLDIIFLGFGADAPVTQPTNTSTPVIVAG